MIMVGIHIELLPEHNNYDNPQFSINPCKKKRCSIVYKILYRNKIFITYYNSEKKLIV